MRPALAVSVVLIFLLFSYACKKNTAARADCAPNAATTRTILAKKAVVKITATATYPVYLLEEGTIDSKLIPCNFPVTSEYYQNDLQVTISGYVKALVSSAYGPCCAENFVISSITK